MKRGFLRVVGTILTLSLLPVSHAFAAEDVQVNVSIKEYFNSDLFIKTDKNAAKAYDDGKWYYDGSKYAKNVTIGSILYNLEGDMNTKADDTVGIKTEDVTIPVRNNAVKSIGLILFSRDSQTNTTAVTMNYKNNISEDYIISVPAMENAGNSDSGNNPIKIVKSGIQYKPTVDTSATVYLHGVEIDLSNSVNKNLDLVSITLKKADFDYYLAALTQVNYSQEEIEEQTKEAVNKLFGKYENVNYLQLVNGENGTSIEEAKELYSAILKQLGNIETATKDNAEKINTLINGAELYIQIDGYKKQIDEIAPKYEGVSSDFTDLSETSLDIDDYNQLNELIGLYEECENADVGRLDEITEYFGIQDLVDYSVNVDNKTKIKEIYDAYTKALKRDEIRKKIDSIYNEYKDKDISQITEGDLTRLSMLISYFDEADEAGLVFEDYDKAYIKHLYEDYNSFASSENVKAVNISSYYNVDTLAEPGESADPKLWYECRSNLNGAKYRNGTHANIASYKSGVLSLYEFEYVKTENYDPITDITTTTYPFTKTGRTIDFIIPDKCFSARECDGILLKSGTNEKYTFDLSGGYSDKVYFMITAFENGNISPTVNFTDGTSDTIPVSVHSTGQTVNEVRNNRNTYPNMITYVTSGDFKDYNMASTGVIYADDGARTNGQSVFEISINSQKNVKSITFGGTTFDYIMYGISERPVSNDVIIERTKELYGQSVVNGSVVTNDRNKISELVLNYKEGRKRGLYFEDIEEDIINELAKTVLTAEGKMSRYDKNTVLAEIEFSVPIAAESLLRSLTVYAGDERVEGVTAIVSDDGRSAEVSIPVTRYAVDSLKLILSDDVRISEYPTVGMVNPVELSLSVPQYITAENNGNSAVELTNNSKVTQEYIVYSVTEKDGTVENAESVSGSIKGGAVKEEFLLTQEENSEMAVLDKNTLAPLCEITELRETVKETNKTADYKEPSLNLENNELSVQGFSKMPNSVVSVMIESSDEALLYAGVIKSNRDGYFCFDIPVNEKFIPISGYLTIKLGGDDFDEVYTNNDVYFPVLSDRTNTVNSIKNASSISQIDDLLDEMIQKLSLNFRPYTELIKNQSTKQTLAERIYNIKNQFTSISANDSEQEKQSAIMKAQLLIKQQAVLQSIESNMTDLFANEETLLYDDIMEYSSIDNEGATLYNIYSTNVNSRGIKEITDSLSGNKYSDTKAMKQDLAKIIMLGALRNPKSSGVGFVPQILTRSNALAAGININNYLSLSDRSQANSHIANMNISSLNDITSYINGLGSGGNNNTSSGGKSPSSGSGFVPTSPISNQKELEEKNAEEYAKQNNADKSLFNDLPQSHWAYNAVSELNRRGIINGRGNGSFAPNDMITRAEFVKILCVAQGIGTEGEIGFSDVESGAWYEQYIKSAYNAGIINGISDTEFGVNEPITRQDICTILYRLSESTESEHAGFADSGDIAQYAMPAVAYFSKLGVVSGFEDNTFRATQRATRAQAAVIIFNYLNKITQ